LKIKNITLLALVLVAGAFFLPIFALANAPTEAEQPQAEQAEAAPPTLSQAEQEQAHLPAEQSPPSQSPWADAPESGNPFTPEGTATVVDNATSDDGKEFFTFQTPDGKVFFLVIDRSRPTNNVYFLNAVTQADLMALAEAPDDTPVAPAPVPDPAPLLPPLIPAPDEIAEEPEIPIAPAPESGNSGTLIFITLAALAFGGAAYYLKIVRPKKQGAAFDEEDEDYEYEYEEDSDDEELEEFYDVEDIIREFGTSEPKPRPEIDDELEEQLFDEIQ